jgi:hypothetical protein
LQAAKLKQDCLYLGGSLLVSVGILFSTVLAAAKVISQKLGRGSQQRRLQAIALSLLRGHSVYIADTYFS